MPITRNHVATQTLPWRMAFGRMRGAVVATAAATLVAGCLDLGFDDGGGSSAAPASTSASSTASGTSVAAAPMGSSSTPSSAAPSTSTSSTTTSGSSQAGSGSGATSGGTGGSAPLVASNAPIPTGWSQIPGSQLKSICPANGFGGMNYEFAYYCTNVVKAWNSAVMDTRRNRLIVWGGGHADYSGNEIYAVNLGSRSIQRLNDPAVPIVTSGCSVSVGNGQANARHTYDGIAYVENLDKMFVFGGSLSWCGNLSNDTWMFDFASLTWERKTPSGTIPNAVPGIVTAYDPNTGLVFLHDDANFYSYDPSANRFTRLASNNAIDYHMTAVIDPARRKFVIAGAGSVYAYDIGPGSAYTRQTLQTSGGNVVVNANYPGLTYDEASGRIVAWHGGDTAYSLNLDTSMWTAMTFGGGPGSAQENGTYKRFAYSRALNAFVVVNSMEQNAHFLRTSN